MKRRIAYFVLPALVLSLLSGCGRAKSAAGTDLIDLNEMAPPYAAMAEEAVMADGDYESFSPMNGAAMAYSEPAAAPEPRPLSAEGTAETKNPAKLIYTADLNLETLEFDKAAEALAALTSFCGGYFESSSVNDQGSYRWASYTVRVPAAQYRTFLDRAGEGCHVLSCSEYTEDVSESYYDTAGRLDTQKTKLDRLQALLSEADSMEDIIALESAISETEENIDWLSGTLRHYDALVDYSTVSVYLEEVMVYEPDPPETFGSRLSAAFSEGLTAFRDGLGDVLVFAAYTWMWLLLIAVVIVLVLWLTRKRRAAAKEERARRRARAEAAAAGPAAYTQPSEGKKE